MNGFLCVVRYVNLVHAKKKKNIKENSRIQINFPLHKSYIKKNTLLKESEYDT